MFCWCWLMELISRFVDSEIFHVMLGITIALLLISNIYSGLALGQGADNDDWETADYNAGGVREGEVTQHANRTAFCGPANNQSPINIETACLEQSYFDCPLIWSHYDELPVGIRLENNGHTVLLRAAFRNSIPFLDGGDLLGRFDFHEISFRWSWYDTKGSDHTVDHRHYPLEMQCLHTDTDSPDCASSQGLLMVSYFFELSKDNPYLDVLVQHLAAVQHAGQCVELPAFPLSYLMPAFHTRFFSYRGSLTEPPYHRGAEWLISPIPLAIGERQLNEFRQLRNRNGTRISWNGRPVQQIQDRRVLYNIHRS